MGVEPTTLAWLPWKKSKITSEQTQPGFELATFRSRSSNRPTYQLSHHGWVKVDLWKSADTLYVELAFQLYTSNVGLWQNQMDILISLYILDGSRTHDIGLAPERNLRILQSRDDRIRTRDLSVRILTALPTKPPSNIKISSETNLNVHLGIDFSALYKQRWRLTESNDYTHFIM